MARAEVSKCRSFRRHSLRRHRHRDRRDTWYKKRCGRSSASRKRKTPRRAKISITRACRAMVGKKKGAHRSASTPGGAKATRRQVGMEVAEDQTTDDRGRIIAADSGRTTEERIESSCRCSLSCGDSVIVLCLHVIRPTIPESVFDQMDDAPPHGRLRGRSRLAEGLRPRGLYGYHLASNYGQRRSVARLRPGIFLAGAGAAHRTNCASRTWCICCRSISAAC